MQRINKFSVFFILVSTVLSGCVDSLGIKPANDQVEFVRGIVSKEAAGYVMTPCYSQERRKLHDVRGLLAKRFTEQFRGVGIPVYMEMQAEQGTDLVWRVDDVMLAGGGSQMCRVDLSGIRFRAEGSEPSWLTDILTDSVRIQSYENLRTLRFSVDEFEGQQGVWQGDLKSVRGQSHSFRLVVRDQSCKGVGNVWYRWSAELSLDGDLFYGCARRGDLTNRALLGRYSNELSKDEAFVVLDLLTDNVANMLLDYRNGQSLIVMQGEWQWKSNDKLVLHFTQQDGREQESFLLFKRTRSGGFVQQGFSPEFGRASFELKRSE
ncbi:hypothetical protein [Neptunomonas sp.]|uniref:hypothetical protein n=1 Tax=Neptunomonas sp. TaxID=1971898 RepID=UPI0035648F3D